MPAVMKESSADQLDSSDDDDNQQPVMPHSYGANQAAQSMEANKTAQSKANRLDLLLKVSENMINCTLTQWLVT